MKLIMISETILTVWNFVLSVNNRIQSGFNGNWKCYCNSSLLLYDGLVDRINLSLKRIVKENTFIGFKRLIANVGIDKAYDIKSKYRWNAPYSKELVNVIENEIYEQYLIITGNTKKCLVLDCDNVLWGEVLSKDGIAGIQIRESGLGRPFQDFQRYLLDLYYHGVIVIICDCVCCILHLSTLLVIDCEILTGGFIQMWVR